MPSKWSIDVAEDMEEVCVGDGVTEMAKMLQRAIIARDERLAEFLRTFQGPLGLSFAKRTAEFREREEANEQAE